MITPQYITDRSRGFTLVEVVVASLLVGGVLVATLALVGDVRSAQTSMSSQAQGQFLAEDLLAEIMMFGFSDPDQLATFGTEAGENGMSRARFDDVDDYHGWSASPPELQGGTPMAAFTGWTRSVEVVHVAVGDLINPAPVPTGLKRIKVKVERGGKQVATSMALRSAGWVDPVPPPVTIQGNTPPIAVARTSSDRIGVGQSLRFFASASSDPDDDALTVTWNFGDGNTDTGVTTSHSWSSAGLYVVRVVVDDGRGGMDTTSFTVEVTP